MRHLLATAFALSLCGAVSVQPADARTDCEIDITITGNIQPLAQSHGGSAATGLQIGVTADGGAVCVRVERRVAKTQGQFVQPRSRVEIGPGTIRMRTSSHN